ncbi:Protein CBG14913 [Caenorhabditis briggsae]|uniref:Protein CBG14913 n=1 Tax=Caenorhabditis briggsae TaxID=6238 RepID=A8XKZ3_CAEBR|nr:Protein CBG14913 [Caenorhabditis briggsae]CAP33317.2 Protein CBG14913 [Caenorhabditis briggsae]
MSEFVLKLGLMLAMFVLTFIVGMSPLKVLHKLRHEAATAQSSSKHKHVSLVLCLLTCFSGGVFLATCFLHLFPELQEKMRSLSHYGWDTTGYPYSELLSCLGFFLIFFLEEVVIMMIPSFDVVWWRVRWRNQKKRIKRILVSNKPQSDSHPNLPNNFSADETTALTATSTKRAISVDKEGEGHCQTHCPLTVHERKGSNECTANATQLGRRITRNRNRYSSYGSTFNGSEDQGSECTFAPVAFAEPERCETNCEAIDEDPPILMKSRPHAHSHGVRSITFVLALSIHSIIEGLAFGVGSGENAIIALFTSLMVHKLIVAFSVGLQLFRTHAHQIKWVIISIVTLASMTPLGALIGLVITSAGEDTLWKDATVVVLQGLAVGTFIYVTFFEVLLHERDNEHPNLLKLLVMFIGFALIGGIRIFESPHGHSHGHEHDNITQLVIH